MSKPILFPSLDQQGWVSSSSSIADFIFSHFFVSDYSQTQLYLGEVTSFPWILVQNQNDMIQAASATRVALSRYFSRYFNNVAVEVSQGPDPTNPSKVQFTIYVSFTDGEGKDYVLGKLLEVMESKISKVININNG